MDKILEMGSTWREFHLYCLIKKYYFIRFGHQSLVWWVNLSKMHCFPLYAIKSPVVFMFCLPSMGFILFLFWKVFAVCMLLNIKSNKHWSLCGMIYVHSWGYYIHYLVKHKQYDFCVKWMFCLKSECGKIWAIPYLSCIRNVLTDLSPYFFLTKYKMWQYHYQYNLTLSVSPLKP